MSFKEKIKAFFTSYKGLLALIILFELGIILFLSTFSQPVVEIFGKPLIPIDLDASERSRVARIIMLYHALAVPFLAAVSYFVLDWYEVRKSLELQAKWSITIGALLTGFSGMMFGYGSNLPINDWVMHGLFIFGLSITFYGGVLLAIALWPNKEFPTFKEDKGEWYRGINLEQFNMAITIIAILISGVIGAYAASNFGKGFEAVLAEDIVRRDDHNVGYSYNEMIVSHLHIMVALLSAAVLLLTLKYSKMSGKLLKISHLLYIPGIFILSLGAWLVITPWGSAHVVINVGAGFLLLVGGIVAVYGIMAISKRILGDGYEAASKGEKVKAIFKDPVDLALYWQLIWVNVVTTFPGVYVAVHLEQYRSEEYTELERTFNTGHWHVLATIDAMMVLMLAVKYFGVKGKLGKFIGWSTLFGTIIGFGFATIYILRKPGDDAFWSFILIDVGVMLMFLATGVFGLWYLVEHFSSKEEEVKPEK